MKKCLAMVLTAIMLFCLIPTASVFAAKEESLTNLTLTVTAPQEGAKPAYDKIDGRGYYSDNGLNGISTRIYKNGIAWYKSASSYFSPGTTATFEGNKDYIVKINLLAKGNFEFAKNVAATVNGKTATVEYCDADGSVVVSAVLTSTTDTKTAINKVDLTVVKPVVGKTPTFAKVDTTQFVSEKYGTVSNCSNGVTWTNQSSGINLTVNNPFKEGVKYRVTYYLTAKDGYKFTSGTKCTINGSTAALELKDSTHAAISLSNLVPGDGKKEISSLELNVTAPKDGEKPSYTKIDGNGYYSDNGLNGTSTKIYKNGIAWYKSASSYISPGTTETFKSGTAYTVKISLLAKDGYKFGKTVTAKINGKTASVETFDDGSINVSLKLTASSKDHTHTAGSTWQFDDMEHWKICSYKDCGTLVGKKQMHSNSDPDGKCDICGYQLPIEVPEGTTASGTNTVSSKNSSDETSDPNESTIGSSDVTSKQDKDKNNENKQDNEKNGPRIWMLLLILPVAALVLAAGGIVLVILLKKKK